ncbi:MAG: Coenzyme F420 hydrogenase/dehydrogenase, beta subunit C-terminal domain [Euryarchaeota archaeon]|nr:Coenzyme F420 hydrogenase/dehydrogenase, beta subunit C-terminal domain [Euryarchaeota archaeon]
MRTAKDEGFASLEGRVVLSGLCYSCGLCVAVCPENVIEMIVEMPTLKGNCTHCGDCFVECPKSYLPIKEIQENLFGDTQSFEQSIGYYQKIFSAQTKRKKILGVSQSGGVVTTLLTSALDQNLINGALVTALEGEWGPKPTIARTYPKLLESARSKYTVNSILTALKEVGAEDEIAVVGLPCHVQALRKLQVSSSSPKILNRIKILIGLFCSSSFTSSFLEYIRKKNSIELSQIKKFDISKGNVYLTVGAEKICFPLKEVSPYKPTGCRLCFDFTSELADISVGSEGAQTDWSAVIIRTEKGLEFFEQCQDCFKISNEVDLETIKKRATKKKLSFQKDANKLISKSLNFPLKTLFDFSREFKF